MVYRVGKIILKVGWKFMSNKIKIAHVSVVPAFSPGVFKKLEDKAKVSKENGLDIDFYLINPSQDYSSDNMHAIKVFNKNIPTNFLRILAFRVFKIANIEKSIPLDNYDAIILRYPLVDGFGTLRFAKKYGYKIFTEHHTDEVAELFSVGRIVDVFRGYLEKYFAGTFLSYLKGIIGVTDEIRKVELAKTNTSLYSATIANGINPQSFSHTGYIPFDGKTLNLIFVASEFSLWHGLEKFLGLLQSYDGDVHLYLRLIGNLSRTQIDMVNSIKTKNVSIEIAGKAYGDDLDNHMKNAHLAISSLALSVKNMKEACTLKSREYIVRGLPFVYAYKDTDLNGDESFAKRFEEDNISLDEIIIFAEYVSLNRDKIEAEMIKYTNIVSWKNKLIQMRNFVEKSLLEGKH
jgi:hypothetical protein